MTRKTLTAMFGALTIIGIVSAANAEIASKAYVDDRDTKLIMGDIDPTSEYGAGIMSGIENRGLYQTFSDQIADVDKEASTAKQTADSAAERLETLSADVDDAYYKATRNAERTQVLRRVTSEIAESVVSNRDQPANGILVTDDIGAVKVVTGGLTNDNINDEAQIDLAKLRFPDPSSDCETKGCMLMYYNGRYAWEVIARDEENGETVSVDEYTSVPATITDGASHELNGVRSLYTDVGYMLEGEGGGEGVWSDNNDGHGY